VLVCGRHQTFQAACVTPSSGKKQQAIISSKESSGDVSFEGSACTMVWWWLNFFLPLFAQELCWPKSNLKLSSHFVFISILAIILIAFYLFWIFFLLICFSILIESLFSSHSFNSIYIYIIFLISSLIILFYFIFLSDLIFVLLICFFVALVPFLKLVFFFQLHTLTGLVECWASQCFFVRWSLSYDLSHGYEMLTWNDIILFIFIFFTSIFFFDFTLLKIKLLYFFLFVFYKDSLTSQSRSWICHAYLDWLRALYYFIFILNLVFILLIFFCVGSFFEIDFIFSI
jgi:hypothetical protein